MLIPERELRGLIEPPRGSVVGVRVDCDRAKLALARADLIHAADSITYLVACARSTNIDPGERRLVLVNFGIGSHVAAEDAVDWAQRNRLQFASIEETHLAASEARTLLLPALRKHIGGEHPHSLVALETMQVANETRLCRFWLHEDGYLLESTWHGYGFSHFNWFVLVS
jgi:hypothetical protein